MPRFWNGPGRPLVRCSSPKSWTPPYAAHYNQADLIEQAIILGVAISQSQAFEDGNKRVAFAAADSFLRLNGLVFVGTPMDLAERLVAVADPASNAIRDARIEALATWVRSYVIEGDGTLVVKR
ncbi:Fic/DOC family protein [Singulisphaera sp. GP187]|uniref:Fic family protein n=1 Tax=Singulisphaera sp. GP187 TaxID=1882752 RepID=UPI0009281292|nr:Fic family protein [Singulisphaera sp. GP187]SIO28678.1 Fic/DOC family protein [Singulisphaera sp. GP187]